MARLRTIKPEFWSSEQVMELSLIARLTFIGMWNFCDDGGVHPASPKTLKAEVFPSDGVSIEAVLGYIAEMVAQRLVVEFEAADGRRYWQVTGWKHQYIKHPSLKYPAPAGGNAGVTQPQGHTSIPPGRGECGGNAGTGRPPEKEKEKEKERSKPSPASGKPMRGTSGPADGFEDFWAVWPKRVDKQSAIAAWRKLKPDAALAGQIVAAVQRHAGSEAWLRDGGQFIPYPSTWLNGRRWEDEVEPAAQAYTADELEVMTAYGVALATRGWPAAVATPYSPDRAAAVRVFLGFGRKAGWVEAYFAWLGEHLPPKEGFGFDWAIQRGTYLRAKEGNFAALREVA